MDRRKFITTTGLGSAGLMLSAASTRPLAQKSIGIIGLDTSHVTAFTKIIHGDKDAEFKVTHAYPHGSATIESSYSRIPRYTEEVKAMGVQITDSIEDLLSKVDYVLLETNDGRLHYEQAKRVFEAKKPVFIDKPIAASMKDVVGIFELAEQHQTPVFSASSLRFSPTTQAIVKENKIGKVLAADIYSPAKLEETHPDLYWYGIHGVESLFTVMGTGCKTVRRIYHPDSEVVIGEWEDGRIGTFRGLRAGKTGYGGTAYGTEGISPAGVYEGYQHLLVEILEFFKTGIPPVKKEETIEIFAFMTAAEESKKKGGKAVSVAKYMK